MTSVLCIVQLSPENSFENICYNVTEAKSRERSDEIRMTGFTIMQQFTHLSVFNAKEKNYEKYILFIINDIVF
jgi:hypothetical protein